MVQLGEPQKNLTSDATIPGLESKGHGRPTERFGVRTHASSPQKKDRNNNDNKQTRTTTKERKKERNSTLDHENRAGNAKKNPEKENFTPPSFLSGGGGRSFAPFVDSYIILFLRAGQEFSRLCWRM